MSLIHTQNLIELDKKIEYLLNEKSNVLHDELRMTNDVLKKIKTNCQEHCSNESEIDQTSTTKFFISKKHSSMVFVVFLFLIPLFFLSSFSNNDLIHNMMINKDSVSKNIQLNNNPESVFLETKYLVQNLKGDTIDTWSYWDIPEDRTLYVKIIGDELIRSEHYYELKNTILSEESFYVDNSITHKGPKDTASLNFIGWKGALNSISENVFYTVPTNFEILSSDDSKKTGDIIIQLTTNRHSDGISGYTESILDGNAILKSHITIYNVEKLSKNQLSTIVRHEFGHALGLAHSSAPEDLMYPSISTSIPFISECNIDAIRLLYDNKKPTEVICKI